MDDLDLRGYTPTIGLEIHAHLKTKTKMFSRSLNNPDEVDPNRNISPVDVAHPGTLPVINKEALRHMVRIGLAVGGDVANYTRFDRKNYFYPDIPKGYQISQYLHPIVSGGSISGFELTRIHLEEDTATSKHFEDHSLVDYNRAGAPLMELVTEPVLHSPEDIISFARELQLILRYLGAGDADIEKGQMRVEVNLSVSKTEELGTKVEVKNIGSISQAAKAARYEILRHIEVLESGGELSQETRGWNDAKGETFSQRSKENAKDYRYFPEPDLPALYVHEMFDLDHIRTELPELPAARRERYAREFGIKDEDIEYYINNRDAASLFEAVTQTLKEHNKEASVLKQYCNTASNYISSDLAGLVKNGKVPDNIFTTMNPVFFTELVFMVENGDINSRGAKDLLLALSHDDVDPRALAEQKGLLQENDVNVLTEVVREIINSNQDQWQAFKDGKDPLIKFFLGQAMKVTKGSGNPELLQEILNNLKQEDN